MKSVLPTEGNDIRQSSKAVLLFEEVMIEQRLNIIRLWLSVVTLVFFVALQLFSDQYIPATTVTLAALIIYCCYSLFLLLVFKINKYRNVYRYLSILNDLVMVSICLISVAYQYGNLNDWFWPKILVVLFAIVSMTTLRQSTISSLFSGLMASIVFLCVNPVVKSLGGTPLNTLNQVLIVFTLLGLAGLASQIVRRQRLLILKFAKKERKQALAEIERQVGILENEVQEQTSELAAAKESAEQRAAELEAIRKASLSVTSSLDLEIVLNSILESTLRLFPGAQNAHIFLANADNADSLTFGAALWSDGRAGEPVATPRSDGLTGTVARQGEMIVVEDMTEHPIYANVFKKNDWKGSIVGLPLKIGIRVVGVMNISFSNPRKYSFGEQRVMELLADQAAIAIQNAHLHELANQQAYTDALTGLPNRRSLNERLEDEIRRAARYGRIFVLVMMDLDGFKSINDTYGHLFGDHVLQKAATCMTSATRDTDFLARYGGDEFALLMPETDAVSASQICNRLLESKCMSLKNPAGEEFVLSISLGQALYPAAGSSVAELIESADAELYRMKKLSKGH
jgi:diguanylate cyclase (GGDEF)-like protein